MTSISRLSSFATFGAALAALLMMLQVVADVVAKYFFGSAIDGTEEVVSYYYMIAVVVLPLATVELKNEHVSVDVLYDLFSPTFRAVCDVLARCLSFVLFTVLGYQSLLQALNSYSVGEMSMGAASIIIWPPRFFLPIGFFLVALVALIRIFAVRRTPKPSVIRATDEPV